FFLSKRLFLIIVGQRRTAQTGCNVTKMRIFGYESTDLNRTGGIGVPPSDTIDEITYMIPVFPTVAFHFLFRCFGFFRSGIYFGIDLPAAAVGYKCTVGPLEQHPVGAAI